MACSLVCFRQTPEQKAVAEANDRMYGAWAMAKEFVERNLRSPGTADYGDQRARHCVTEVSEGRYRVVGWVDAQNGFGATVRMYFVCDLQQVGEDRWRCR